MNTANKVPESSFALKLAALLSIVRWKNIFITAIAQYLAFLFVFNTKEHLWHSLGEIKVHMIIISTALIIAAGYIINNFYDEERDLVNRPYRTRFQLIVSKGFTLNLYLFLNALGLLIAGLASWRIFVFFLAFSIALWFYSHKLGKIVFVAEFVACLLSVTAFFSLFLYFKMIELSFVIYGFTLFLVLFSREIYKDIKSIKGDIVFGYRSIATTIGISPSISVFQVMISISILVDIAVLFQINHLAMLTTILAILITKILAISLVARDVVRNQKNVRRLLQLIIALYIAGIVWL